MNVITQIVNPNFYMVLVTQNLEKQKKFYQEKLLLDLLFDTQDVAGLGRNGVLEILIREDHNKESHHQGREKYDKGPFIPTFKFIKTMSELLSKLQNYTRGKYEDSERGLAYLFVEDFDKNELCLECLNK